MPEMRVGPLLCRLARRYVEMTAACAADLMRPADEATQAAVGTSHLPVTIEDLSNNLRSVSRDRDRHTPAQMKNDRTVTFRFSRSALGMAIDRLHFVA
jgi:hypothetical protein